MPLLMGRRRASSATSGGNVDGIAGARTLAARSSAAKPRVQPFGLQGRPTAHALFHGLFGQGLDGVGQPGRPDSNAPSRLQFRRSTRHKGFQKIVHIESDAFVLSERMMAYINGLEEGWTAFWCPIWQIPETAIQVIGCDQFEKVEELARLDRADPFFLGGAEYILPFTNVVKFFKGDRYAEYAKAAPDDADYICQLDGAIKDSLVARLAAGGTGAASG